MTTDSDIHPPASNTASGGAADKPAGPAEPARSAASPRAAATTRGPGSTSVDTAAEASSPSLRPKGGRLLASLALLVALGALGGAGYLYYALIQTTDVRSAAGDVASLRGQIAGIDQRVGERLDQLADRQQAALDELRQQEKAARTASEQSLRQTLADVARQAPPSTGEWQRAEAQYLLRIANHRLLLEHDASGALQLLQAADSVLADLDDFALHEVRARIADEIASLQAVKDTDVEGLFLRLEAVKRHLDELPIKVPEYLKREATAAPVAQQASAADEQAPAADNQWWAVLKRELSRMVRVRHFEGAVKPLLAPDEAVYLEQNLRLMLERAQLAAVRREQMVYEESLNTAIDWIHQYLNTAKPAVQRMLDELDALQQLNLAQPLPDISGSLNALKEVLRHPE